MRAGLTPRCVEPAAGATTRYCCVPVRLTVTREEKVRVFVVRGVAMVLHAPVPTRRWTASFLPVAFAPLTLPLSVSFWPTSRWAWLAVSVTP